LSGAGVEGSQLIHGPGKPAPSSRGAAVSARPCMRTKAPSTSTRCH